MRTGERCGTTDVPPPLDMGSYERGWIKSEGQVVSAPPHRLCDGGLVVDVQDPVVAVLQLADHMGGPALRGRTAYQQALRLGLGMVLGDSIMGTLWAAVGTWLRSPSYNPWP